MSGYLHLFALGVVDHGEIGHLVFLLIAECRIVGHSYLVGHIEGSVGVSDEVVGLELGQVIGSDFIEVWVRDELVQGREIVCRLTVTMGSHQVIDSMNACIDASRAIVGEMLVVEICSFGFSPESLEYDSVVESRISVIDFNKGWSHVFKSPLEDFE